MAISTGFSKRDSMESLSGMSKIKQKPFVFIKRDTLCIEDLNTKGIFRNRQFAKSIADIVCSSFVTKLQYKSDWYGREMIKMDQW